MSSLGLPGGSIRRKLSDRKSKRESFNTRSALLTMSQGAGAVAVPIRIPQETREQIDKSKPFLAALFGQAEGRSPRDIAVNPNFKNVTVAAFPERQPVYNTDNSDPTVVDIAIHSKVGNKQRRAKADTGACANFMSYTTAISLGLDIRDLEYNEKVDYITANDGTFQAEGSVSVEWHRLGSPRTRSTKFFVIQSEYFDVILGKDFLLETKFFMINPEVLIIHKDQKKGKSQNDADRAEKEKKQKEANLAARQKEKEKAKAKEAKEKATG